MSKAKIQLLKVDPLVIALGIIERGEGSEIVEALLGAAKPYNSTAADAYQEGLKSGFGGYFVHQRLANYFNITYPVNNNDVSNNWMLKLQGCSNNVEKSIPVLIGIFALTTILGGNYVTGIISTGGATIGACVSGLGDYPLDDNKKSYEVKTTGSITGWCDTDGNCYEFPK